VQAPSVRPGCVSPGSAGPDLFLGTTVYPKTVRTSWAYRAMRSTPTALRVKRFEVREKARKVASLETAAVEFEHMVLHLAQQIAAEEQRTGVKNLEDFAYSTLAKATTLRRAKLLNSVADLRAKLDLAKREHERAESELRTLEPAEMRDADPPLRKLDHIDRRAP
jgi:flagellar protein FliJ